MPAIRILDKQVAELIAAGEVVERPSAVIKELVENAIDAGASVITVEIRRGGTTYMRVTDNGCGISKEDVPIAFMRHATSKVSTQDDLTSIGTLGFRGEALASISAVAHVELLTRADNQQVGVRYLCGGETEAVLEDAGCPKGTTLVVRDLFFNVPARMKFLKKDVTEGNSVAGVLDKLAMSHPEISFRLVRDGKEQLHTPGDNKLLSAIYAIHGKEFTSQLIPVEYQLGHVKVNGFITTPVGSRPNRSMQNFFINGRFIRSRTAMAALEEAYKGSIMVGKFPGCILHMEVAWEAVDVNVHPAKLEVRFINERPIFDAVYHGVRSALAAGDKLKTMELKSSAPSPYTPALEKHEQIPIPVQREISRPPMLMDSGSITRGYSGLETRKQAASIPAHPDEKETFHVRERVASRAVRSLENKTKFVDDVQDVMQESSFALSEPMGPVPVDLHSHVLGEAFGTYILLEYGDEIMLIDKHAAHERLIYEQLKARGSSCDAQALLEPVAVSLDKDEYSAVLSHQKELLQVGFDVSDFGSGTVLVRSAPLLLDGGDAAGALMEIAGYLTTHRKELITEHMDWIYHNVACRAAMKAGDHTNREELISLAADLERNPQVRYCPHGRPVYILIKRKEIEKQFGRM